MSEIGAGTVAQWQSSWLECLRSWVPPPATSPRKINKHIIPAKMEPANKHIKMFTTTSNRRNEN